MTADKGQTISRLSCLTVTVTRFFVLRLLSAALFPQSENISYFRDMKRFRLFVLSFYHIATLFATNTAVNKPQQTATPVDSLATHLSFSYLSAWVWWESGLVCQRRAAILEARKRAAENKIPVRPFWGRPLTDCALALPFRLRRKVQKCTGNVPLLLRFICGRFGNRMCIVHPPCLLFPAVKVYNVSKKSRRYQF